MHFWLFKTEPSVFSYQALVDSPNSTAAWDGVRNFQARNYLRDSVAVGDELFFYHSTQRGRASLMVNHSSIPEPAIVGIAKVVKAGYPDHTAWDPKSAHFDPKCSANIPTWFMVDVQAVRKLARQVTLSELKTDKRFAHCSLFTRPRLSIQPITRKEWLAISHRSLATMRAVSTSKKISVASVV